MNCLQVSDLPQFDNSVEGYEIHTYNPYNNSFRENDEIRIPIHQQDVYVLPSASSILIEGSVLLTGIDGKAVNTTVKFTNNPIMFLFQDIRYELNGVEIERIKDAGITTTMKSFISMNEGESKLAGVWGWNLNGTQITKNFSYIIPLNKIMGFAEDYNKIILNCKHELIFNRTNHNLNCLVMTNDAIKNVKVEINKIQWRVPHIKVSDREKLTLFKILEKDKPIQIAFRNWDLYEYPLLPKTTKHSWSIKTTSQLEKPRFVILGLQTGRKYDKSKDCSQFDHCDITNVSLFLNSNYYPYEAMNLKFSEGNYHILYEMYANFRQSYYNLSPEPLLDLAEFKNTAPLFVIDCSRQNEQLKTGPIDVRLEIESSTSLPDKTTAYCLIINDRLIEYKPLTNIVRKLS